VDHPTLHARLLSDAKSYDPNKQTRGLLAPFRDVILLWRVKFMSYEQVAARLTANGLKVSPAAVGVFCRRQFTKAEILRERQRFQQAEPRVVAPSPAKAPTTPPTSGQKRGPKIARDDY
jgi:hypothetical protein